MTIHEKVLTTAASDPGRVALVDGPTGQEITYGALAERAQTVAGLLGGRDFGAGDRLALWAPNTPAWAGVTLGAMAAGGAVAPISPMAVEREVEHAMQASGASLLVTIPPFEATARAVAGDDVLVIGPDLLAGPPAGPAVVPAGAPALLPFSSGTTGAPKAIALTHANLLAGVEQTQERMRYSPADRVLAVAPFAHIMGAVVTLLTPLAAGATVVTMPRFDVEGYFDALERHRITITVVAPPIMRLLAFHPLAGQRDLSALEVVGCGGAPLPPALQEAVQRRFPDVRIGQGYGMTETSCIVTVPSREHGTSPGCVGFLGSQTEARIVDGELQVRGPHVIGDGWLRTGDLAEFAGDGELKIVGRVKELIKVNGHQVSPAELEALMLEFPGVEDVAVIGRPDERRGEVPVCFVVGNADPDALTGWLHERVAPYKRLAEVRVVESLPRSPAGKLLRRVLAEGLRAPVAV
jgi:acyl-CoA synthetase (AMP-forming)/AMP-acid ligase II